MKKVLYICGIGFMLACIIFVSVMLYQIIHTGFMAYSFIFEN